MGLFKWKKTDGDKPAQAPAEARPAMNEANKPAMKELYGNGQPAAKAEGTAKTDAPGRKPGVYSHVLVKPLVTEKATNLGALNKYAFAVSGRANKIEVAKAVTAVYGIKPVSVSVIGMKGKKVRHGRVIGRRKDWKKAIVTLPAGQSINIYEGV